MPTGKSVSGRVLSPAFNSAPQAACQSTSSCTHEKVQSHWLLDCTRALTPVVCACGSYHAGAAAAGSTHGTAPNGGTYYVPSAKAQQILSAYDGNHKPLTVDIYMGGTLQQEGLSCTIRRYEYGGRVQHRLCGLVSQLLVPDWPLVRCGAPPAGQGGNWQLHMQEVSQQELARHRARC
jgi:hypothetical protein